MRRVSLSVNGRDIEPGALSRTDFAHSCRLYRTENGLSPLPDEPWLLALLRPDGSCPG